MMTNNNDTREFQPRGQGVPRPSSWDDATVEQLRRMVEDAVRRSLDEARPRLAALLTPPTVELSETLSLAQWISPFVRDTIFEAMRFAVSLQRELALPTAQYPPPTLVQFTPPTPAPAQAQPAPEAPLWQPTMSGGFEPATAQPAPSAPTAYANGGPSVAPAPAPTPLPLPVPAPDVQRSPWDVPPTVAVEAAQAPAEAEAAGELGSGVSVAPWLVGGQVTLLASPFEGFADVQRFLDHLNHLHRVHDVRPKRFSAGRLYVTLGTDFPDAAALADALETELARYRPSIRSVQTDLIELIIRPPAE